jgi:hypothetical protein
MYLQNGDKLTRGIKLLGLVSWGYIKDNDLFVNEDTSEFSHVR